RCADRAARRRGAARAPAPELGRVHDPVALRAMRGRLRPAASGGARRRAARHEGCRTAPRRRDGRGREALGRVMYALYTAVVLVALVLFYVPAAVVRFVRRGGRLNVRARLGFGGPRRRAHARAAWLHAVSVGE